MTDIDPNARITALAERSSYIENVLRHALVAGLSSELWQRDPAKGLQVFVSEVDDSGFDLVLSLGAEVRYVQLKQAHDGKVPSHCSARLQFSSLSGACIVLMSYSMTDLQLTGFRFFGGARASDPMPEIGDLPRSVAPGRRNQAGERKVRANYRNVPIRKFRGPIGVGDLLVTLFPAACASVLVQAS